VHRAPVALSIMAWFPPAVVLASGVYLLALGVASIIAPESTKRFLGGFANSARTHFTELFARLVGGTAFIATASQMRFSTAWSVFGWILIGTTVVLLFVPWKWHRRFASWSVPLATRRMTLFALAPLAGGVVVLYSLFV
jgi:hypothetical protein